ncbi:MAG: adenylosuccinate synthetase [Patescibacteria group bacterium]
MKKTFQEQILYLTDGVNIIAIICYQYGDTGKGKIVNLLCPWAYAIYRGVGGPNAAHTFIYKGKPFTTHLLPSGITEPGVKNIIGSHVALDLLVLNNEIDLCSFLNLENLHISHETGLIMPWHILEDITSPESKLIGTTACGVGPFYADPRLLISMNDLSNEDIFITKLNRYMDAKQEKFNHLQHREIEYIMTGKKYGAKFGNGKYFDDLHVFNRQAIIDHYLGELAPRFVPMIIDLKAFNADVLANQRKIILEGSQGTLISSRYGTTFYQTMSDTTVDGLAQGCGFKVEDVDRVLGIVKGPVTSRVGGGPFVSELGGKKSEEYCRDAATNNAISEQAMGLDLDIDVNSKDEMIQGIVLRIRGGEYGGTTTRPRRMGWDNLVELKYSIEVNKSPYISAMKFDTSTGLEIIRLCTGYKYSGPPVNYAGKMIKDGDEINEFIRDSEILYRFQPVYTEFPGWTEDISKMRSFSELPKELVDILVFIEKFTGAKIMILSVGRENEETIFLNGELRRLQE